MSLELPPSVQQAFDATNRGDPTLFLAAFAADAVLDDSGREFAGHARIAEWDAAENIGMRSKFTVLGAKRRGADLVIGVHVTGDGFNGGGTFTVSLGPDGTIARFVIR